LKSIFTESCSFQQARHNLSLFLLVFLYMQEILVMEICPWIRHLCFS